MTHRVFPVVVAAFAAPAFAQFVPVIQERSVVTQASVSSGASDGDSDEAAGFGPFVGAASSSASGAAGASALGLAGQTSVFTPLLLSGTLSAGSAVATGATFVTGESDGASTLLFIFSLAAPTPVQFTASGTLAIVGSNPNGEPSDLFGVASVRLLDANTQDQIAGFFMQDTVNDADAAFFAGTLPAGQYALLARATTHAFSADLLGPPARSGSAQSDVTFAFSAVPAPGSLWLLGLLAAARRRR